MSDWLEDSDGGFAGPVNISEFLAATAAQAEELRRRIQAECTGLDESKTAVAARRTRVTGGDYRFFGETYFPHWITPGVGPSRLHLHLFEMLPALAFAKRGITQALAAPRGEAKSTHCSVFFILFCIASNARRLPVIISDTWTQASLQLEAVKLELQENPRLMLDFPEICGAGRAWRAGEIVTKSGVMVVAKGAGQGLRGIRNGPTRPDLIVIDDLENDEAVRKPENRDRLLDWLNKAVLGLGDASGRLVVLYIGTILHHDAVLARCMRNKMWRAVRFQAVIRWPDRMDLWDQWQEIILNEGPDEADEFYAAHQTEMNGGAEVSWPDMRPLVELMRIRARVGAAAFASEYQNDPTDAENAAFKNIQFWVRERRMWVFFGACDPSLGKHSGRGDPSAILVGALDRETGILDVAHADIRRRLPDLIIEDIIAAQAEYRCLSFGVEAQAFQFFLFTELIKRSAARGVAVPAVEIVNHTDKTLRIQSLEPHVRNGLIRLRPNHSTLISQLEQWPMADHDDGPDALEMLWRVAQAGTLTGGARISDPNPLFADLEGFAL
jgi:predicted phage terminase large subunit-like protein